MSGSGGSGDLRPVGAAQGDRGQLTRPAFLPDVTETTLTSGVCFCLQASIMTGTAISLGVDGVGKPPPESILSHSRMSPLRRNSLLNQGNLLHHPPHLHQGAPLNEEPHLHDDAQGTAVANSTA